MVWVEVPGTAGDPQPDDRPAGAGSASAAGATCAGGASDNAAVRVATTAPRRRANRHDWGLLIATAPNRVGTGGDSLRPNFEAPRHPQTAIYRSCRLQGPYVHDPDRGEAATFVPNALEASLRSTRSKHEHRHQYVDGRSPHHAMPSGVQLSSKSRPTLITLRTGSAHITTASECPSDRSEPAICASAAINGSSSVGEGSQPPAATSRSGSRGPRVARERRRGAEVVTKWSRNLRDGAGSARTAWSLEAANPLQNNGSADHVDGGGRAHADTSSDTSASRAAVRMADADAARTVRREADGLGADVIRSSATTGSRASRSSNRGGRETITP
jgi:hypothetical protein